MAVTATLPLLVQIGDSGQTYTNGNDFWDDTAPDLTTVYGMTDNPRWRVPEGLFNGDIFAGVGEDYGHTITQLDNGILRLDAKGGAAQFDNPYTYWQNRNLTTSPSQAYVYPGWDLYDNEIYFQLIPPDSGDYFGQLRIRPVGYTSRSAGEIEWYPTAGSGTQPKIELTVRGYDDVFVRVTLNFDITQHRWVRWSHDASADTYTIYTSGGNGDPWYQQVQTSAAPVSGVSSAAYIQYWDLRNSFVDFALSNYIEDASFDVADYVWYVGPWNQVPVVRELPLLVDIGDPLVTRVTKTLPLLVDIGDVSP